jgi:protein gp37
MNRTKIEWCDGTFNPVTGCLHGCDYCYARKITHRFAKAPEAEKAIEKEFAAAFGEPEPTNIHVLQDPCYVGTKDSYPFDFEPTYHRYRLKELLEGRKPQNIFVCSMADLFGNWVPQSWVDEIMDSCCNALQHKYLFLTKNPANAVKMLDSWLKRKTNKI